MATRYDIFISYRRETGSDLARNIYQALRERRFLTFMDVEDLRSGKFNKELYKTIQNARDFVVVMTPGCLDRCGNDDDWLRSEIRCAIQSDRNIVPVFHRDFRMPPGRDLPDDISAIVQYNGVESPHDLFAASIDRLSRFLRSRPRTWWDRLKDLFLAFVGLAVSASDSGHLPDAPADPTIHGTKSSAVSTASADIGTPPPGSGPAPAPPVSRDSEDATVSSEEDRRRELLAKRLRDKALEEKKVPNVDLRAFVAEQLKGLATPVWKGNEAVLGKIENALVDRGIPSQDARKMLSAELTNRQRAIDAAKPVPFPWKKVIRGAARYAFGIACFAVFFLLFRTHPLLLLSATPGYLSEAFHRAMAGDVLGAIKIVGGIVLAVILIVVGWNNAFNDKS